MYSIIYLTSNLRSKNEKVILDWQREPEIFHPLCALTPQNLRWQDN